MGYEEPEIVKVAGFIPCPVSKGYDLLSGDFVQAVDGHRAALRNVVELLVGTQNLLLLDGKEHGFRNGDVHVDRIRIWEWALIAKIECVAVDMALPVFPIKGETNPGCLGDVLVDFLQAASDLCEIHGPSKGEVQIFREAVVAEVAAFKRGAAFEYEKFTELTPAQSGQKPCQTVIPFQHGFRKAAATVFIMQPVCQQREIALWDHV